MKNLRVWLLAAGAVTFVAGCNEPVAESQLAVAFVSPTSGQIVTKGNDADATTPGLQLDVEVEASDASGLAVELESATLFQQGVAGGEWAAVGVTPVISGNKATFPAVTLLGGEQGLRVMVGQRGLSAGAEVRFTAPTSLACAIELTKPSRKLATNLLVTQADDLDAAAAGAQFKVEGKSSDCFSAPVRIFNGADTKLAEGTTDASGNFSLNVSLPDGEETLKLEVVSSTGDKGAISAGITVDTSGPMVTIDSPTHDGSPYMGPAVDVSVSVVGGAPGTKVKIFTGSPPMLLGELDYDVTGLAASGVLTNFPFGTQTISATAVDELGNTGTAVEADVAINPSTLAITTPVRAGSGPTRMGKQFDGDPSAAGAQTQLAYSPAAKAGERVAICANLTPRPAGKSDCPGEPAGGSWYLLAQDVPATANNFTFPEGVYQIKAVLQRLGTFHSSPTLDLVVDLSRPSVVSIQFQGDANADRTLNLTELPLASPKVAVVTVSGVEDGQTVTIYSDATKPQPPLGSANVVSGVATVTLTLPSTLEATYTLVASVTDLATNPNQLNTGGTDPRNDAAFANLRIDQSPPSAVFTAPLKTTLGIADNQGGAGFGLRVEGAGPNDLATLKIDVAETAGSTQTQIVTASGGTAGYNFFLANNGTRNYTATLTPTDSAGNVGSATSLAFTVDLDPPVIALTSPNAAGSPYGTYALGVSVNVTGAEGAMVTVRTSLQANPIDVIGPVTGGVATRTLTFPNGIQTVTAQVSDAAGNSASASQTIEVNGVGCSLQLTSPSSPYLALADDADLVQPQLQYRVRGHTSTNSCFGGTVSLLVNGSPSATTTADGSGDFFFDISAPEGALTLRLEMDNGAGVITFDERTVTVDTIPPVLSAVSPSATTLFVVAPTNSHLPDPAYVADTSTGTAGGQFAGSFTATGAQGGTAQVFYKGSALDTALTLASSPQTVNAPMSLPHDTSGVLEVRVRDAAGNLATHVSNVTVDVIAPAAPVLNATVGGRTQVNLSWTSVGDDGSSGTVNGYDLRWTTQVLSSSGIDTEARFFNTSQSRQETGALLSAATLSYSLKVPWLTTYGILVRAVDEVGNYSAFTPSTPLANLGTSAQLANPGSFTSFATVLDVGDLNGDGRADVVAGAPNGTPGGVYVYYGSTTPGTVTASAIAPPDSVAQQFGAAVSIGQVGDETSEGLPDLIVGAPGWTSNQGRAFLYFGKSGALDPTPVIFVGNAAGQLGRNAALIGDINGDGLGEVLLSAPTEASNRGHVYLFYGRSKAAWQALAAGNGGSIGTAQADRRFDGPSTVQAGTLGNLFGRDLGFAYLGDLNGDGFGDFTIPQSHDVVNREYIFSGALVNAGSAGTPITTGDDASSPNQSLQTLSQAAGATGNTRNGFGVRAFGNVNVLGGSAADLVVVGVQQSTVYLFADGTAAGFSTTPTVKITGGNNFGSGLGRGDLDGDGRIDLAVGENQFSTVSGTGFGFLRLFFNRGGATPFDTAAGNGFFQSVLTANSALGVSAAIADFNGDGRPDVIAGDSTSAGKINVWY